MCASEQAHGAACLERQTAQSARSITCWFCTHSGGVLGRACLVEAPGCQVVVQSLAVRQRVAGDALAGIEDVLAQATGEAVGQVIAQALQVQRQALVEVLHMGH